MMRMTVIVMMKRQLKKKLSLKNVIKKEKGNERVDTKVKVKREKDIKTEDEDFEEKGPKKLKKRKKKHKKEKRKEKKTSKEKSLERKIKENNEEGEPFCFRCNKGYHQPDRCPKDGEPLFEWQRGAPREGYLRTDAQVSDKPFGIQVQMTRCLRCHEMGHSHTEKFCPQYGKARDHDEPEVMQPVDKKKLLAELRDKVMTMIS